MLNNRDSIDVSVFFLDAAAAAAAAMSFPHHNVRENELNIPRSGCTICSNRIRKYYFTTIEPPNGTSIDS